MTPLPRTLLLLPLFCGGAGVIAAEGAIGPGTAALRAAATEAALRTRADQGDPGAQYQLGLALAQGRGGLADPVEAFVWLTLAAEGGRHGPVLDGLFARLTGEQITEARSRLETRRARRPAAPAVASQESPTAEPRPPLFAPPLPETAATSAAERAALRKEVEQLRATLSQQSRELAARRVEAEAARQAALRAGERPAPPLDESLRTQLAAERSVRQTLETQVNELQRELGALQTTQEALREELSQTRAAQSDADQKLATLTRTHSQLEAEKDQLVTRLATQTEPSSKVPPQTELQRLLADAHQTVVGLRAENARLTDALARAQSDLYTNTATMVTNLTAAANSTAEPTASTPLRTHVVSTGDTLSGIALRYYGNANKWREIFTANRDVLRDERTLATGRTLRIPSLTN